MEPPDPVSAIVAGGNLASNYLGQKAARRAQQKQLKSMQVFNMLAPEIRSLFADAIGATEEGFDEAFASSERIGSVAKSQALMREREGFGMAGEDAINRGLYSTGYLDSQRHAVRANTNRTLATIDEARAGLYSQMLRQRGASLANLYTGQAGALSNLAVGQAQAMGGIQFQGGGLDFSGLGPLLGQILGTGGGGGGSGNPMSMFG